MSNSIGAVVTVHNKENTIAKTLRSLLFQSDWFTEVVVLDDGSTDKSAEIVKRFTQNNEKVKYVFQKNYSVSKSLNAALIITDAEYVAVFDGDIELDMGWFEKIMPYFENKKVAAVSGLTKTMNPNNLWAALAGYNLEYRQSRIAGEFVDHLSSTNVVFKKSVLEEVGLFDPEFRYGQDNESSYRIAMAGYRLVLSKKTFCFHFWPETFVGFMRQRMHGAWARVKLIEKHPKRLIGDKISSFRYFIELPLGLMFLFTATVSVFVPEFLFLAGLMVILIYGFTFPEMVFFFGKGKFLIGVFMPVFVVLRAIGWVVGIISAYF